MLKIKRPPGIPHIFPYFCDQQSFFLHGTPTRNIISDFLIKKFAIESIFPKLGRIIFSVYLPNILNVYIGKALAEWALFIGYLIHYHPV